MAKIECPICDRDVSSQDAMGLGDSFKRHLIDVHRMTSLACIDMNEGVEPAKEVSTYEVTRQVTVERPVGATYREPTTTESLKDKITGTERDVRGISASETEREREARMWPAGSARSSARVVDEDAEAGRALDTSGVSPSDMERERAREKYPPGSARSSSKVVDMHSRVEGAEPREAKLTEAEREREARTWPAGSARSSSRVVDEHARAGTSRPGEAVEGRVVGVSGPREQLEDVRRTAPEFAIKCPFCNSVFRADDDDELGRDLKSHWGDDHQIRPTIRAELHMASTR